MKSTTSITVDTWILEAVRKNEINLSVWVNTKLKEFFANREGKLSEVNLPLTAEEAYLLASNMQAIEDAKRIGNKIAEDEALLRRARIVEIHHELNELTETKLGELDPIKIGLINMKQEKLHKELETMPDAET